MKVKKWKLASFLLPCLLLFALIYLAPMCMVFGSSFFEWKAGGVFKFIGLDNYINAFKKKKRLESPQNYLYDPECGICSGTGCYFLECI